MNKQLMKDLVGTIDLDDSLLGTVVGGQGCPPPATSAQAGCPQPTTIAGGCGGGTTPDFSCVPPGYQCP